MRFLTALWCLGLLAAGVSFAQPPAARPPASNDTVFIVSVSPASFVDGVESEVEVVVAYQLETKPEGAVEIASNTFHPQGFTTFTSQRVVQGSGTVTLRGKLTPRFWTANIVPRLSALLAVPGEELTQRKVIASDQKAIAVALRPNPSETYAVNPNPSVVYEDGVRIKSITPDRFVEGQSVDIEVVVTYELLSREVGDLTLGFTHTRPNSYVSVAKEQIKTGKGEIVLHGRVTPKRTGSLPFAKVQVTLFEFPRRSRAAPLATDNETVEVTAGGS